MKKTFFKKMFVFIFALSCFGCKELNESDVPIVSLQHSVSNKKVTDLLQLEGFTVLDKGLERRMDFISKALFREGKIFLLNNSGDFQDLLVFDEITGSFLGKLGNQGSGQGDFEGMNDIVLNKDLIRACIAGKYAFFDFNNSGQVVRQTQSGIFGEELEKLEDGYVAYNEYNATDISGNNHLIFYDDNGNITSRLFPYPDHKNGMSFGFAGSLSYSDGTAWFNPPFSDTIFQVNKNKIIPRFIMDFGTLEIPESIRNSKINGEETYNYGFIGEGFFKSGAMSIFQFYYSPKICNGIFDERTKGFLNIREAEKDFLFELLQIGLIFPKDSDTFAWLIPPDRMKYLISNNLIDFSMLARFSTMDTSSVMERAKEGMPLLLYLRFKKEG